MSKRKIFFDLDGTLIDSTLRLYYLFQHLVPISQLDYNEYWQLKRGQKSHEKILFELFEYNREQIEQFTSEWMTSIEEECWLNYDKPIDGTTELLERLSESMDLYIVTSRQFTEPAERQIAKFGWNSFVKKILVTNQKDEKAKLINVILKTCSLDWFVGDTGIDIQQGKILGVRTAGVLTGFRSKESLERYNPDIIVSSVLDVPYDNE